MPRRVLICGGRDYADHRKFFQTLDRIAWELGDLNDNELGEGDKWLPDWHIISGAATGADSLAIDYAVVNWCGLEEYPADWTKHGKKAGYLRNKQMLEEGKPDLVIAFPGGKGTANMIKLAKEAGVEVIEVE